MVALESLRIALQSLWANPLRSFLTLIGIAVGIGAVLHVVGLGKVTQQSISDTVDPSMYRRERQLPDGGGRSGDPLRIPGDLGRGTDLFRTGQRRVPGRELADPGHRHGAAAPRGQQRLPVRGALLQRP